jgi:hypothetical protein
VVVVVVVVVDVVDVVVVVVVVVVEVVVVVDVVVVDDDVSEWTWTNSPCAMKEDGFGGRKEKTKFIFVSNKRKLYAEPVLRIRTIFCRIRMNQCCGSGRFFARSG